MGGLGAPELLIILAVVVVKRSDERKQTQRICHDKCQRQLSICKDFYRCRERYNECREDCDRR